MTKINHRTLDTIKQYLNTHPDAHVRIEAPAGKGKTWAARNLAEYLSEDEPLQVVADTPQHFAGPNIRVHSGDASLLGVTQTVIRDTIFAATTKPQGRYIETATAKETRIVLRSGDITVEVRP